jgi:hypothetical protein
MAEDKQDEQAVDTRSLHDRIMQEPDAAVGQMFVKEWNNQLIRLRTWTAGDKADFDDETSLLQSHLSLQDRERLATPRIVAWSIIDDKDQLVFKPPTMQELRDAIDKGRLPDALAVYYKLLAKRSSALSRIYKVVCKLNALDEDTQIELEKN